MFCPECGYKNTDNASFCFACGSMLRKSVGDGRYSILKVLGKGGMGQVMLVHDNKMDADIVLKQLIPPKESTDDGEKLKIEYLENRMKEEAKLLYRLNYRGLPNVMDFFAENGNYFLTMQYIKGKNLAQILAEQSQGKIDLSRCIRWMDRLLDILDFVHSSDPPVIHRDIKPQNIMLDESGMLYLVDFGLAVTMEMKREYTRVGTYDYASPEHYTGSFDLTSDIYSLGATFYHLITGLSPRDRVHPGSFPPLNKYVPECPEKLQLIFDKMLSFSKENRYHSCLEIRKELRKDPTLAGILTESIILKTVLTSTPDVNIKADESESQTEQDLSENKIPQIKILSDSRPSSGSSDIMTEKETPENKEFGFTRFLSTKPGFAWISILAVFLAITAYLLKSGLIPSPFFRSDNRTNYTIKVIVQKLETVELLKKTLDSKHLKYFLIRRRDFEIRDKRFMVLSYFDSRSAAATAYIYLKDRGMPVAISENPEQGIFIYYNGIVRDKYEGEKLVSELNDKYEMVIFSLGEVPVKYPAIRYELIVPGITSKKSATELQEEFSKYSGEVELKEIEHQEDKGNETLEK